MPSKSRISIYNIDCLEWFANQEGKGNIDLVLVDLPYGQTECEWDACIDLKQMWKGLDKLCKQGCWIVFFATTRFGVTIINSRPAWFRYDLVWKKSNTVGFLNAKNQPLRQHEMIYVFGKPANSDDDKIERNHELRAYAKDVVKYIGKPLKEITKAIGNMGFHHFYGYRGSQFTLPTPKTYDKIIRLYKINDMPNFKTLDEMRAMWVYKKTRVRRTYNPQKTDGKSYKTAKKASQGLYGKLNGYSRIQTGRYPTSIIEAKYDAERLHTTQKPVSLLEWLIKTYSNPGETVLDFTMGSGSTGVAAIKTGRNFIGVEKDNKIFKTARARLIRYEISIMRSANMTTRESE